MVKIIKAPRKNKVSCTCCKVKVPKENLKGVVCQSCRSGMDRQTLKTSIRMQVAEILKDKGFNLTLFDVAEVFSDLDLEFRDFIAFTELKN